MIGVTSNKTKGGFKNDDQDTKFRNVTIGKSKDWKGVLDCVESSKQCRGTRVGEVSNADMGYGERFQATSYLGSRVHGTISKVDDEAVAGSEAMVG